MEESELTKGIKDIQKEIVVEVDRICKKNNLRYFLAYGTLIGALRHNGFIPWDDDIDIMMPFCDMQKFAEACKNDLNLEKFFYQSPETEVDYKLTINRVRRNGTTMLESNFVNKAVHTGVFVDIYPLYGAAKAGIKRKIQVVRAMLRALYLLGEPVKNHGKIMEIGSKMLLAVHTKRGMLKKQAKLFRKISACEFDKSETVTALDSGIKEMSTGYKRTWFGEGAPRKFEDLELNAPIDSDSVLKTYYGDYMKLPPENERCFHHNFVEISLNSGNEKKDS